MKKRMNQELESFLVVETKLEHPHLDFLWKAIEEGNKKNLSHKN